MSEITAQNYTAKELKTENDVRWCPGCGDYSILAAVQRTIPNLNIPREKLVFVSGIGCSSRFPYYMNTYGFHTIHGRAPAIATGIKVSNPDLSVWVISGDGDALSIGGNHFIHMNRRNLDVNFLLFNNEIYGLTKGQASPTSKFGTVTKTSVHGTMERPANAVKLAIASGSTFVARTIDKDPKHMQTIIERAAAHKGTSVVEIYQNCLIFNDGVYDQYTDKESKSSRTLYVEDQQPLLFDDGKKGISFNGMKAEVIDLENEPQRLKDVYIHSETENSELQSYMYAMMTERDDFPNPFGVFHREEIKTFDEMIDSRIERSKAK
ncbi:MAG: 2-oxoacid:ferredoxin oxidoreductase subunit beta [Calditrichaeota bacterium]|nr:2-oxoacid:ferredoxin oxidoreductase subunit beta [Calditrichota bacterium]